MQNAVVTDVLPDGLTFEYGSVMVDGSTTSSYTYEQASRLLTVNIGSIDPDTRRTVSFVATVNEGAYNTTIQNLATLTADNTEPVQDKDDGVVVADGRTDLSVAKNVNKSSAKVGDKLTYTVQVSNGAGAQVNIRDARGNPSSAAACSKSIVPYTHHHHTITQDFIIILPFWSGKRRQNGYRAAAAGCPVSAVTEGPR